jgi:hypothetical protein
MGWNEVSGADELWPAGEREHLYFVHSYYGAPIDPSATVLTATHAGVTFCAAARVGPIFATQFHPEKSQQVGLTLLERFVARCRDGLSPGAFIERQPGFYAWQPESLGDLHARFDYVEGQTMALFHEALPPQRKVAVMAALEDLERAAGRGPWLPGRPGWELRARYEIEISLPCPLCEYPQAAALSRLWDEASWNQLNGLSNSLSRCFLTVAAAQTFAGRARALGLAARGDEAPQLTPRLFGRDCDGGAPLVGAMVAAGVPLIWEDDEAC